MLVQIKHGIKATHSLEGVNPNKNDFSFWPWRISETGQLSIKNVEQCCCCVSSYMMTGGTQKNHKVNFRNYKGFGNLNITVLHLIREELINIINEMY